jgi:hypothetical protein
MSNKKLISEDLASNRFKTLDSEIHKSPSGTRVRPGLSQSISNSSEESNISTGSSSLEIKSNIDEDDSGWQVVATKKRPEKPLTDNSKSENSHSSLPEPLKPATSSEGFNQVHIELVRSLVEKNIKTLVIMRGCPGSGKSTLAR